MRRLVRDSIGVALVIACVAGCGGKQAAERQAADDHEPATDKAVPKEFDVILQSDLVSKGVYLLDGEKLKVALGFPNSPRITDLNSQDEAAITMTLKRQSSDARTIVGKWDVQAATRGDESDTKSIGDVIEFTADKMIHTRSDGRSQENGYRLGGVPPTASAGQAELIATLKEAGAEIELGPGGEAVSVSIMFKPLSDEQFAKIATMSSIRSLELVKVSELTATGVGPLSNLSKLEKLTLMCDNVSGEWLAPLVGLTNLKSLELSNSRQLENGGLQHLSGLKQLTELRLADTKISDAGLAHLTGLTNLEQLELKRTKVSDAGLRHLKGMTKLRELDVSGAGMVNGRILSEISDTGVAQLTAFQNLQVLGLNSTKITDTGLQQLSGCKNLKMLFLTHCDNLTNNGVAKFKASRPDCQIRGPGIGK